MPVRNGRAFIQEAVSSVLSQDFQDLELLVIDDGSSDWDYGELEQQDSRVRVIRLEGRGVSFARNTGIAAARGRYIAFLDADDYWFPGKLGAQVRYFDRHPEAGVVFGAFLRWCPDETGHFAAPATLAHDCSLTTTADPERSGWLYSRLLQGLLVGMNTAVVRRELMDQIGGFDTTRRLGEDYDLWLRASQVTELHALADTVALYRIHAASAMHRPEERNGLAELLVSAEQRWGLGNAQGPKLLPAEFARRLGQVHFDHGYTHYWHGSARVARREFTRAFLAGFRRGRSALYVALALLKGSGQRRG
jgi:glycosyltransferase involved in cell wall biosynthesis